MRFMLIAAFILCGTPVFAQRLGDFPTDVQAVFKYMIEKEYPEVYGDKSFKARPEGYEVVDIDGDGVREVFLWLAPYYHQSPTILIYQILADGTVRHVKEGLAPGPLVPFTGELVNAHRYGSAADIKIPQSGPMEKKMLVENYLKLQIQVVQYRQFFHTAKAGDEGGYVDMTYQKVYTEEDRNQCGDFQFSPVKDISSGRIGEGDRPCFVALTGDEIYIYRITGITESGLLDKTIWVVKKPDDFSGFARNVDGHIRYWTGTNEQKELLVDFAHIDPVYGTN